jgi:hypothetical protein
MHGGLSMADRKGHGYGRWSRAQVVAIIATYWRKGWTAEEVSRKLGTGLRFTEEVIAHVEWTEGQVGGRSASGSAGTAGRSSERSEATP